MKPWIYASWARLLSYHPRLRELAERKLAVDLVNAATFFITCYHRQRDSTGNKGYQEDLGHLACTCGWYV